MPNRLTEQECHDRVKNTSITLVKYAGKASSHKSLFSCKKCGHTWTTSFNNISQGVGCRMCSNKKTTERQLMPKSEWIKRLEGRNIEILEFGKDLQNAMPIDSDSSPLTFRQSVSLTTITF
jgi:DNA replicative helicase MCM subunit Mcm2 (Cdc46/Mcm family)